MIFEEFIRYFNIIVVTTTYIYITYNYNSAEGYVLHQHYRNDHLKYQNQHSFDSYLRNFKFKVTQLKKICKRKKNHARKVRYRCEK